MYVHTTNFLTFKIFYFLQPDRLLLRTCVVVRIWLEGAFSRYLFALWMVNDLRKYLNFLCCNLRFKNFFFIILVDFKHRTVCWEITMVHTYIYVYCTTYTTYMKSLIYIFLTHVKIVNISFPRHFIWIITLPV